MRYTTKPFGNKTVVVQTATCAYVGQVEAIGRGIFFAATALVVDLATLQTGLHTNELSGQSVTPNVTVIGAPTYLLKWNTIEHLFLWPMNMPEPKLTALPSVLAVQ